jgi:tetratricopeptide (TPR) repeat protein
MWLDPGGVRGLENWPGDYYTARIAHSRGQESLRQGRQDEAAHRFAVAEKGYRRALRRREAIVDSANNLASMLVGQGRYMEAREACYRGLAIDDAYLELLGNLGVAEYYLGRYSESAEAFRKALNDDPRNRDVRVLLIRSLCAGGDLESAIADLRRLVEDGLMNLDFFQQDPVFEGLRKHPEYREILEMLERDKSIG